jgi:hypothetical protein
MRLQHTGVTHLKLSVIIIIVVIIVIVVIITIVVAVILVIDHLCRHCGIARNLNNTLPPKVISYSIGQQTATDTDCPYQTPFACTSV